MDGCIVLKLLLASNLLEMRSRSVLWIFEPIGAKCLSSVRCLADGFRVLNDRRILVHRNLCGAKVNKRFGTSEEAAGKLARGVEPFDQNGTIGDLCRHVRGSIA